MDKDLIRTQMILLRKKIPNKERISTIIVDKIINLDVFQKSKVIALYKSMDNEVNTKLLINRCIDKKILLPRVTSNKIEFIEINSNTQYRKSKIGVIEPIGNKYTGNIDLIIVPGISFDKNLNRLGFGKGYYDRYLKNRDIFKIGICFDRQMIDSLPITDLDISMDIVITEKRIIKKVHC